MHYELIPSRISVECSCRYVMGWSTQGGTEVGEVFAGLDNYLLKLPAWNGRLFYEITQLNNLAVSTQKYLEDTSKLCRKRKALVSMIYVPSSAENCRRFTGIS